jgi:hypothetical protein
MKPSMAIKLTVEVMRSWRFEIELEEHLVDLSLTPL